MPQFSNQRRVNHTADQMFDLVADVERYPDFVPLCQRLRVIQRTKNAPWDYVVFGVKEIHKMKSGSEVTDRIVGQYNVRLVEERRTEVNPSGLLVAEYSEKQMVGERDNGLEQKSELDK